MNLSEGSFADGLNGRLLEIGLTGRLLRSWSVERERAAAGRWPDSGAEAWRRRDIVLRDFCIAAWENLNVKVLKCRSLFWQKMVRQIFRVTNTRRRRLMVWAWEPTTEQAKSKLIREFLKTYCQEDVTTSQCRAINEFFSIRTNDVETRTFKPKNETPNGPRPKIWLTARATLIEFWQRLSFLTKKFWRVLDWLMRLM